MRFKAFIVVLMLLYGCSPQTRLNRLIDRNPELNTIDTITISDTTVIEGVKVDTLLTNILDTVYITEDRLRIKTIYKNDTLYLEAEVLSDTIIKEHTIYVDKVKYVEQDYVAKYWKWALGLLIVIGVIGFLKKLSIL